MQWNLSLLYLIGQCILSDCQVYEYHYIKEENNWTEAQQYCKQNHANLATVTNMTDMKRLLNISTEGSQEAWIGLYNPKNSSRQWHWSLPGQEYNERETNWSEGEPTDTGNSGAENCGHVYENLSWVDTFCQHKRHFLCYDERNAKNKYHLIIEKKNWQEAQSYCREKHTDLVSGLAQLQDGKLKEVMNSTMSEPYFGLFRDTWRWSDGSSFSFRHWKENNMGTDSDKCAVTAFDKEGRWKEDNCNMDKPFICYGDAGSKQEKVILIKENKTWEDALLYCREHHHDLVTITNLDEQRRVQETAKNATTDYVWMGLHYACTLDLWFWISDEVVSYKNWGEGEPMDDCDMSGAMKTGGKHQWRKKDYTEKFNFICFKD